jgi:hypothetical protein
MRKHLYLLLIFISSIIQAQSISGIVNTYHKVTGPEIINSGHNIQISVDDASGLFPGQMLLMMQMKGAEINTGNNADFGSISDIGSAGNYELCLLNSINGNLVVLHSLQKSYNTSGAVQLIGIPTLNNAEVSGNITAPNWSDETGTGGVVALLDCGTLTLNAGINVNGRGFRGGAPADNSSSCGANVFSNGNSAFGIKGEGISSNLSSNNNRSKGRNANGGGGGIPNQSGGAGGSGFHAGGSGGRSNAVTFLCASDAKRAIGGIGLNNAGYSIANNRIFMGGGGGGATRNNSAQNAAGNGGGIVIIGAQSILANDQIIAANGAHANIQFSQTCGTGVSGVEDGGGGGGGAGVILLDVQEITGTLNLQVNGGNGASTRYGSPGADRFFGPGGGGGAGMVWLKHAELTNNLNISITGGLNGVARDNACNPSAGNAYGASAGEGNSPEAIKTDLIIPGLPWHPAFNTVAVQSTDNPENLCEGSVLTLSVPYPMLWNTGAYSESIMISEAGTYSASLTLPCGVLQSELVNVTFATAVPININASATSICGTEDVELSISDVYQQVSWSNGSQQNAISINIPGTYTVMAEDNNECLQEGSITIAAGDNAIVSVLASNNGVICQGETLSLTVIEDFDTYTWSNGLSTQQIQINEPGAYWVQAISAQGCSGISDTIHITLNEQLTYTVQSVNGTLICGDVPVNLLANENLENVTWSDGSQGMSVNASVAGSYFYTGVDENNCLVSSEPVELTALALPIASFSQSQEAGTYVVTFTANENDASSFLWIFHDGSTCNIAVCSFEYPFDGSYNLSLIASNECGADTLQTSIQVEKLLSISEFNKQLRVFPNPFKNDIFLAGLSADWAVELSDLSGRKIDIVTASLKQNLIRVELPESHPEGIYLLKALHPNGQMLFRKIMKRNA